MAVRGPPTTAEAVLTTLLVDNHVTSWKVAAEGQTSVFVLRLTSNHEQPAIANTTGQWRRKPPSQLRRDQQRADKRRKQVGQVANKQDSSSAKEVFPVNVGNGLVGECRSTDIDRPTRLEEGRADSAV